METTICAISTPPGLGAIAIIRISGEKTIDIVSRIWEGKDIQTFKSHTAHLGTILDSQGKKLDKALLTIFHAPNTFTGETIIELATHGSKYIQQETLNSLITAGAVLAQPGEFTRRAFLNKKIDLIQTDAIAQLIHSTSRAANTLAINQMRGNVSNKLKHLRSSLLQLSTLLELELDFSEEEVEFADRTTLIETTKQIISEIENLRDTFKTGKAIKEGVAVAIIGPTNAGKSSLLNTILQDNKAIVSDIHGTTRDTIEDTTQIEGIQFRFIDTAGIRQTTDQIEKLGIERSKNAAKTANIVLLVSDQSTKQSIQETENTINTIKENTTNNPTIIHLQNKTDLPQHPSYKEYLEALRNNHPEIENIPISTHTSEGIENLQQALVSTILPHPNIEESTIITNTRHFQALNAALESANNILSALSSNIPTDLVTQDVRETINHLGEITGEITSMDILQNVFANFCIGK